MPAYDYKCLQCKTVFEETRLMEDRDAPSVCPKCGDNKINRVFTAPRLNVASWRTKLSSVPGEIEAIDANMYDTGAEVDDIIKQVETGTYY